MSRQNLQGFDETIKAFKNWQAGYLGPLIRQTIQEYTEYVYSRSQELVPVSDPEGPRSFDHVVGGEVESGHLKRSGGFSVTVAADGTTAEGRVWYNTSYATYVHEKEKATHKYHGQWKYLETAATEFMTLAMSIPFGKRGFVAQVGLRTEQGAFGLGGEFVPPPIKD